MGEIKVSSEDVDELREVLKVVGEEIPKLIRNVIEPLKELMEITYDVENARERAKAIAIFYKELIDNGIPEDLALKLVREHFINPVTLIKSIMSSGREEEG